VLAHWWAQDPLEMRTEHEIYSELLLACVDQRLEAVTAKNELVDFRVLLTVIASNKHHPGFNIADGTPIPPRPSVGNPYQPLLLYPDVSIPAEAARFVGEQLTRAWALLLSFDRLDFDLPSRRRLDDLYVSRQALAAYCDTSGIARPQFWFAQSSYTEQAGLAEADFKKWFRIQTGQKKRMSKGGYFDEARRRFPALTRRAFDRAWAKTAPKHWRAGGAPMKAGAENSNLTH
jgi:hypothetical protein